MAQLTSTTISGNLDVTGTTTFSNNVRMLAGTLTVPTISATTITTSTLNATTIAATNIGGFLEGSRINFGTDSAVPYASETGLYCGISFRGWEGSSLRQYGIYTEMEDVGGNYSKLTFGWHTGIRIGAHTDYGGVRFYNNSPVTGTEIFSVGNGDSNVRVVNNLYFGASLYGSTKLAFETGDTWLRINQAMASQFISGVWFGTSNVQMGGGELGLGSNGTTTTARIRMTATYSGTTNIFLAGDTGIVTAVSFNATSKREYKTDILKYKEKALTLIDKVSIVKYKFKNDEEKNEHIGFIADDTPEEFSGKNHDTMELGDNIGILLKAVQELNKEIRSLKKEVNILKKR